MEKKELTFAAAKEKALRLIEFRSHSEKELRDKLRRAGAEADHIDEIVVFLKEYRFLDDESYAQKLAQDLKNLKKYGKRRITQELRQKGISQEFIDSAVAELGEDDTEELFSLVEKRIRGDFEKKSIDRTVRYFIYRGYRAEDIFRCIESLKEKEETDGI
ncbi:MAG: regulatory protein RecX [Ruminococcaceae bacterium]|nr:regulatory protein RecX [Oscillospiraceae bacterium]